MVGQEPKPTVPDESGPEASSAPQPSTALPDDGLRYFGPNPRWRLIDYRELWRHRELLWMLVLRDLKVRYRQAVIGIAWVVLQPLSTALVFVVLFGLLGHTPGPSGIRYGLFVLPGVVIWQLCAGILTQSTGSLVANQHLIGKVYFPRLVLPLATVFTNLVDFTIGLLLLLGVMAAYGFVPSWPVVFLPVFVLLGAVTALAVGIWAAALNAMYRDTGFVIPFVVQVGFFLSPVIYATDTLIPERWRPFLLLNPMSGVIEGFRWSLLGIGNPPVEAVGVSAVLVGLTFVTGLAYFRRVEGVLADRI